MIPAVDVRIELAPYAVREAELRGRIHTEVTDPIRGPFGVDRRRIMSCTAFRRLEHKTQVFSPSFHDHFRTRLTHTLEVAELARSLSKMLQANAALSEAISLAHDLGHPPFGHAGEAALNEILRDSGGFHHNTHSLRVVEFLEHPYPAFRGLNLTREVLDGLRAHETRYDQPGDGAAASVEARIASVADRIAYNVHDLEDAIGAELIGSSDVKSLALWRQAVDRVRADDHVGRKDRAPAAESSIHAIRRPVLDAVIDELLNDFALASRPRLLKMATPGDAEVAAALTLAFSDSAERDLREWEQFLMERVYRHPLVARSDHEGRERIQRLFEAYRREAALLPPRFAARIDEHGFDPVIRDYIVGMTDRFCLAECDRVAG